MGYIFVADDIGLCLHSNLRGWLRNANVFFKKLYIALHGKPVSELHGAALAIMRSHSVTCHPTQMNAPRHNLSQRGQYPIYLPGEMED